MDTGHPWCARFLDVIMRPMYPARRHVVPRARGRVLEIGVGTGLNFDLYDAVDELVGVEPDPYMLERARPRAAALPFPATLHQVGAEALPFESGSFDTAVVTFTICTIPDPAAALREVYRTLKPGGELHFVEHTRSIHAVAAALQTALTPLWKQIGGGCHLNRPAGALIRDTGFALREHEPLGRESWTLLPIYRGVAVRAA